MKIVTISGTAEEIAEGLELFLANRKEKNNQADFKNDRITTSEAVKLAGVSQPTFTKWVRSGLIPRHGSGKKHFYYKTEVIEALKQMVNNKLDD